MAVEKEAVLERLHGIFPDGIIYKDTVSKKCGIALDSSIYRMAKANGQTRGEWLTDHGFIWRETGYIEPDMMKHDDIDNPEDFNAFSVADYVFRKYPLAGEFIPNPVEANNLYQSASSTVKKILEDDFKITKREAIVLTLETINLLRDWSTERVKAGEADSFWHYVYMQYGFHAQGRPEAEQLLYNWFRRAIDETLRHYNRFIAPKGTQKYYTSLLLHAMAPKASMEALFNLLFSFYVDNLDFQYIPEDVSYKVFTRGMRARWDSNIVKDQNLQLRSDEVFSGLQALFRQRPGFMSCLSDEIVRKMDTLLRGTNSEELNPEQSYLDALLIKWYHKKSAIERKQIQGSRQSRKIEYVAVTRDRISIQYTMADSLVGLSIPRIRLPQVGDKRPRITVFQDGQIIFQDELSVSGNDLCLTTRSRYLPLQDLNFQFNAPLKLRVEIEYLGEVLYQSGEKLYRSWLLFDTDGRERISSTGTAWLFTNYNRNVEFEGETGVYQSPHPGQLYRLNLGEVTAAVIDGNEIFADEVTSAKFRHHTSARHLEEVWAIEQGRQYEILPKPFTLSIRIPEGERTVRYWVSVDGERFYPEAVDESHGEYMIFPPESSCVSHSVRVVDIVSGMVRYEYRYMILPECSVTLDRRLYREGVDEAEISISWTGHREDISMPVPFAADSVLLSVSGLPSSMEIQLPIVHCSFLEKNAFELPDIFWHRSVPPGAFVELTPPDGWTGRIMLGLHEIPVDTTGKRYELGNLLRSGASFESCEPLWISLRDRDGNLEKHKLTEIVFQPKFMENPVDVMNNELIWKAENNYIGDESSVFQIILSSSDGIEHEYHADNYDRTLDEAGLPDGRYLCKVFLRPKSIFAAKATICIYNGDLTVGIPEAFMFDSKEIRLEDAFCWDFNKQRLKTVSLLPGCAILRNFSYIGNSIASGEEIPAPQYSAMMYFTDRNGQMQAFSQTESRDYEEINPVGVWVINEHLLILHCATEDGVQIDNRRCTLINRKPDGYMTRSEQFSRLETPDYFAYRIRGES